MARTLTGPQAPDSQAVLLLKRSGGPSLLRLADLAGVSDASVSRGLAGLQPLDARIVGVLRVLLGPERAERIAAQAEVSRYDRLREQAS